MVSSAKVKASRRQNLLKILQRTKQNVSPGSRYRRPTSTAEKRKAAPKKTSPKKTRSRKTKSRMRSPATRRAASKKSRGTRGKCRTYLKSKISTNIKEYKKGRYTSRAQAVAVSYRQVAKKHPSCKRVLKRRSK